MVFCSAQGLEPFFEREGHDVKKLSKVLDSSPACDL